MKNFIIGLMFLSPFFVCAPYEGVTHFKVTGPSWMPPIVMAQPDGSIRMDVGGSPNGATSFSVVSCIDGGVWGEVCSTPAPFDYTRPAPPPAINDGKLVK